MFAIAKLFLSGIIGKIIGLATAGLKWLFASKVNLLIGALIVALAWGWLGHRSAAKWERVAHSTETAWKAEQANVIAAQEQAKADQEAADKATTERYSALARESEHEHRNALEAARRSADAYAAANRVRPPAITACRSAERAGETDLPADPSPFDGPGDSPDMVGLAREDFDQLTKGAAVQAAERGNYLNALIVEGWIIEAVQFGQ